MVCLEEDADPSGGRLDVRQAIRKEVPGFKGIILPLDWVDHRQPCSLPHVGGFLNCSGI